MRTDSHTAGGTDDGPTRRSVLGTIGGTVGATALAGQASADAPVGTSPDPGAEAWDNASLEAFEDNLEPVREEFERLLETLSEMGELPEPTLSGLGFDGVRASVHAGRETVSVRVANPPAGTFLTYETLVSSEQFDSDIRIMVRPRQGVASATARRGEEVYVLTSDAESFVATSSADWTSSCTCTDYGCSTCRCPYGKATYRECDHSRQCSSKYCMDDSCCEDDDGGGWW